jgi:uncharacterized protein (DUF885 family)
MRARLALALALVSLLGAGAAATAASGAPAEPAPNKALHALFEREFRNDLEESPETGTLLGLEGYDHRLSDYSPAAVARRRARVPKVITELERFDPRKLSTQDRISREVMLDKLRLAAQEHAIYGALPFEDFRSWMPVSTMHGPHASLSQVAKATRLRSTRDYDNYLKRLAEVPRMLEQQVAAMRAGIRSGWVAPRAVMTRVPALFDAFARADVTATPLWTPFAKFADSIGADDRRRIEAEGRRVLSERVHPAFAAYRQFLETEYLPACRATLGATSLPGGARYYALRIKEHTTTNLSAEEIHEIGLKEVARIRAGMDEVMAATKFRGTFAEFMQFLNSDPQFFYATAEERLRAYRDIGKRADAELPKLFAELPRTPYGIRAMEAYEGDNADHYSVPALDGSRAGFFDANVNNLKNQPSFAMEATLMHEAVPGHHLQIARAMELKGLPEFRRSGWYVAYGEGWALYAESLGYEMGFYTDPYQRFGALSAEMLRACRLVVDTGVHAKGWTRDQAIRYLVEISGSNEAFATAEADRYIAWAGQALGYKIGALRIRALRDKAAQALGERFDLRGFHNAILDDGALPLTVLEARIDEWIAARKRP